MPGCCGIQPGSEDGLLANDNARLREAYAGFHSVAIGEYLRVLGSKPALGSALNWYRANIADRDIQGPAVGKVRVSTMFTWSDGDRFLCADGARLTKEYVDAPYPSRSSKA